MPLFREITTWWKCDVCGLEEEDVSFRVKHSDMAVPLPTLPAGWTAHSRHVGEIVGGIDYADLLVVCPAHSACVRSVDVKSKPTYKFGIHEIPMPGSVAENPPHLPPAIIMEGPCTQSRIRKKKPRRRRKKKA